MVNNTQMSVNILESVNTQMNGKQHSNECKHLESVNTQMNGKQHSNEW